jgi:PAS domain S-box-containing protein
MSSNSSGIDGSLATDLHVQATYRLTEALVAAENRARRRVELLSEIVFETDDAGVLVFLNDAWTRALGLSREACTGRPLTEFVIPEDHAVLDEVMRGSVPVAATQRPHVRILRPDGKVSWLEVSAARLPEGGVVGALHDITSEKQAQDELAKLSLVASYTDNFVVITDRSGRVEWVNQAFTRRTGYTFEEMVGRKPGELLQGPDTDPATVAQIREWLHQGRSFRSEILNYTKSGEPYWATFQISPIRNVRGEVERYVSIQTDSTALRRAQQELQAAKERAESANEAKTQFLATISHEMRTPLNVILGSADLILDGSLQPFELPPHLTRINASAESLLRLITDMLDLSKIEAGQFDFERIPIRLRSCVESVLVPIAERAREKGLDFQLRMDPALPSQVLGDPDRMRQIVINLAENAVKFTERGFIRVDIQRVTPGPSGEAGLLIRVADSGSGIPLESQARIFARFEQVDGSTTRRKGGAGLGLNIVKTLVEALGGTVGVLSRVGEGSEFRVLLPLDPVPEADLQSLPEERKPASAGATAGARPPTVLVAEDTEANFAVARIFLTTAGFLVLRANNGREAVELAPAADLILMDIEMPEMDGLEATRRIREAERAGGTKAMPILALTGHAVQGYRERCLAAGCSAYLTKPIRKQHLVDAVRGALAVGNRTEPGGDRPELPDRPEIVRVDPEVAPIVPQFLEHCGLDMGRLRAAHAAQDWIMAARVGHGMKGAALTMGFDRVAELSNEIVDASHAGAGDRIGTAIEALDQHLRRVSVVPG